MVPHVLIKKSQRLLNVQHAGHNMSVDFSIEMVVFYAIQHIS
jgi:hypothetical protein